MIWWDHAETPADSRRRLDEVLRQCAAMPAGLGWWAVERREGGRLLGNAVLRPAPYDDTAELGYHLLHEAWGHGYATEAARALVRHGFGTLALPVISAVVHVDNGASHPVAERAGLRVTGPLTFHGLPHLRYEINRENGAGP